jgi:hypothetical protein
MMVPLFVLDAWKAALKRPHSKRWRAASNALSLAERLECGRFSAAFERPQFNWRAIANR